MYLQKQINRMNDFYMKKNIFPGVSIQATNVSREELRF